MALAICAAGVMSSFLLIKLALGIAQRPLACYAQTSTNKAQFRQATPMNAK